MLTLVAPVLHTTGWSTFVRTDRVCNVSQTHSDAHSFRDHSCEYAVPNRSEIFQKVYPAFCTLPTLSDSRSEQGGGSASSRDQILLIKTSGRQTCVMTSQSNMVWWYGSEHCSLLQRRGETPKFWQKHRPLCCFLTWYRRPV